MRRLLVLGPGNKMATFRELHLVRDHVRERLPTAEVFAAAGDHFVTLNRGWDEVGEADGVSFAIQAQAHASDDLSVLESLDGQAAAVWTAIAKGGGLPVAVSSVALGSGGPNDPPDPRQASLFGACWTVGSFAALAWAGASSVTYMGLAGAWGLIDEGGSGGRASPHRASLLVPMYHVLADLAQTPSSRLLETATSGVLPSAVLGIAVDRRIMLMVGNISTRTVRLTISGLAPGHVAWRVLDAATASIACRETERYRAKSVEEATVDGRVALDLGPFAIATISQSST